MKKKTNVIPFLSLLLILSITIFTHDGSKEILELYHANRIIIINEEGEIDNIVEDENLPDFIGHVYYRKSKFPDNIDKWEHVANISFYNNNKKIMDGKIIRLDEALSDKELYSKEHLHTINDYYYLYTVKAQGFIFKRTYCSTVDERLIERLFELE